MKDRAQLSDAVAGQMQLLQRLRQKIPGATLQELAALLQLECRPVAPAGKKKREEPDQLVLQPSRLPESAPQATLYPPREKTIPFLYHARTYWKEEPREEASVPAWFAATQVFDAEIHSPEGEKIPSPRSFSSWSNIWPLLHGLFREEKRTHRLDVPRIVRHAVKQQPIESLPWQKKRRWPYEIVLLIDTSRHLAPYFRDYEWLALELKQWFRDKLRIVICTDGEQQRYLVDGREQEGFPADIAGTDLLYLGDLGFLDRQGLSPAQWYGLGETLHKRSVRLHALLTVSPADCRHGFSRWFSLYSWDNDGIRPVDRLAERDAGISPSSQSQVEDLLILLSPAIEIHPALVRQLRTWHGYGVSVESLLVQHPALVGFAVHFQWRSTEIQQTYRDRLREQGQDLNEAWETIQQFEPCLPIELQVEQRQKLGRSLLPQQQDYLRRLVKSQVQGTLSPSAADRFMGWIGRMAARAGGEAWLEDTVLLYGLYWKLHNRKPDCIIPAGVDTTRLPEWLIGTQHTARPVTLRQWRGHLVVSESDANGQAEGIVLAGFDWSAPAELSLSSEGRTRKVTLVVGTQLPLPETAEAIEINTATQIIHLEPLTCPSWARGIGRDRYGLFVEVMVQGVEFVMRWMPPGEFMMGSPGDEPERDEDEGPQHLVRFARGFWLAETACTQALWQAVMGENPSRFKGDDLPVENVSWIDIQEFIEQVNRVYPGLALRLPSEAEWEYGCRAGTSTPFWFGRELTTDRANYDGNFPYAAGKKGKYREKTVEVKRFRPNPWGLYQVHGNVWEWCADPWHENYEGAPGDGRVWEKDGDSDFAVLRGGSWISNGGNLRSASRSLDRRGAGVVGGNLGFRLARGPESLGAAGGRGRGGRQAERGTSAAAATTGPARAGNEQPREV